MNPWLLDGRHAFYQRESDGWWAARIVCGRVFVCERIVTPAQAGQTQMAERVDVSAQAQVRALKALLAAAQPVSPRVSRVAAATRQVECGAERARQGMPSVSADAAGAS
jgi:hypothetical protein